MNSHITIRRSFLPGSAVLLAVLLAFLQPAPAQVTPAVQKNAGTIARLWPACPGCNLSGHDFSNKVLDRINLTNANLQGANFSGAILKGVILTGANLSDANFTNAHIEASLKSPTRFTNANLTNADFKNATLNAADLQYADIGCANFSNAVLTGAVVSPLQQQISKSCKASFTGAQLSCSLAAQAATFDFTGAVMPNCPPPPLSLATTNATATWSCPNLNLADLSSVVYVATNGQDNSSCGQTSATPCQTIAQGLAQCAGTGCGVLVYYGSYNLTSTLALSSGKNIYGGCITGTAADSNFSIINAPAGGIPAISANNVSSSLVQGFSIIGSAVTTSNGAPSITAELTNNSNVTLSHVSLTGGQGGNGAAGAAGSSGTKGGNASGINAGTNASCNTGGGKGGVGMTTHVDYNGTSITNCPSTCSSNNCNGVNGSSSGAAAVNGGGRPNAYCQFDCIDSCNNLNGYTGGGGANGSCGSGGSASPEINGAYVNGIWTASSGGDGGNASSGGGGGGGGGGAACGYICFWVPDNKDGGPGGGGGAGSCGATPGRGGQQGGASIALQVQQSTVTLNTVTIVAGKGGNGGNGGNNGASVQGGTGAYGTTPSGASPVAGTGGTGGSGGWGGSSGAGAGGNGGPSFGITFISTPQADIQDTTFYSGYSGGVGTAGPTASNPSGSPCQSTSASVGSSGRVTDYISFN